MTPKTPAASGISRLLKLAGFERSTSSAGRIRGWRNYTEGFSVTKDWKTGSDDIISVTYNRGLRPPSEAERIRPGELAGYAEAITAAGYSAEIVGIRLIVTAKPASLLAAKDGDPR